MWSLFLATSVLADCSAHTDCNSCLSGVETSATSANFECLYYTGPSANGGECMTQDRFWSVLAVDGFHNLANTFFTQCASTGSRAVLEHKGQRSQVEFKPAHSRAFKQPHSGDDMAAREAEAFDHLVSLARSSPNQRAADSCSDSFVFCVEATKYGWCVEANPHFDYVSGICPATCGTCADSEEVDVSDEGPGSIGRGVHSTSSRDSISRLLKGHQRSNQETSFEELARSFLAAAKQRGVHEKRGYYNDWFPTQQVNYGHGEGR